MTIRSLESVFDHAQMSFSWLDMAGRLEGEEKWGGFALSIPLGL